jgi:hypothetical protein
LRYQGGIPVSKVRVRRVRPGDVVFSAQPLIEECRLANSPIAFVEDGKVIREYPDGRRVVIASI